MMKSKYFGEFVKRMLHRTFQVGVINKNVNLFLKRNRWIYLEDQ